MSNLTHGTYEHTGGGVMCYSAMYKGRYWVFGATDKTMSAYSVDPLNTYDDDGCCVDPETYLIEDATDFPTWREVFEHIRKNDLWKGTGAPSLEWVRNDILQFQRSLDFHVNYEFPEDDPNPGPGDTDELPFSSDKRLETIAPIIEIFEDFLEDKGIVIENDEKKESESPSNIYGTDWGNLCDRIEAYLVELGVLEEEK